MNRFTDEGDIITVCDKCGIRLDKDWLIATIESVDKFGFLGPRSEVAGMKDVLELCRSCYYEMCEFRNFTRKE